MNQLTFRLGEIERLVEEAEKAWPNGTRKLYGDDGEGPVDPGFWLVGDEGVYLMHNGMFAEGEKADLIYAEECNPIIMDFDDWWDAKRATFGSDDGVEFVPKETVYDCMHMGCNLVVMFREDELAFTYEQGE